jgi:dTDP-glucose 4,6-dehydratase
MKVLVTGGAGFIGSNFVKYFLQEHPSFKVVNLDKLTYAGNLDNLSDVENNPNYKFIRGDICDKNLVEKLLQDGFDAIINFAAETHVDRSLYNPEVFVETNIKGTQNLMDLALKFKIKKFVQISTDEVYGSKENGHFTEESPLLPNNPYSASKAGADLLVRSYVKTFKLPAVITRSSNNFGPYQFPEKFIPLFISNAMSDQNLPLYGDGLYIRDWLFVEDNCSAIDLVLQKGEIGEIYNISANSEKTNLDMAHLILDKLGKPYSLIQHVKDRPAHDRRYALDSAKIRNKLDWNPKYSFEKALEKTVEWYQENQEWWKKVKTGEYLKYYEKHYLSSHKI